MIKATHMLLPKVAIAFCAISALDCAQAALVTFNSFPSASPANFTSGTEDGFTITATNSGIWVGGFGFPTPSAGANNPGVSANFVFTTTGLFQFENFDVVNPFGASTSDITVSGFLAASLVAQDVFSMPTAQATPTNHAAFNLAGVNIDSLTISFTAAASETHLIDNVAFSDPSAVPVPTTFLLLGSGVFVLLGRFIRYSQSQCRLRA